MKEINIAKTIINKRREKGLTQDELAAYIGVSKASVSKWETGQSYPDITFLPQLATFFDISIDELMDYEPQMKKEDIRKLYLGLSSDFSMKPFTEVLEHCHVIMKKYFSCYPLLFQIGTLIVNNSSQAGDMEQTLAVIEEAKGIFLRVKSESKDAELCRIALDMEAFCALILGNAGEVIDLLEGVSSKIISSESLLASAYQMTGRSKDAKEVLQVGIYQHMGSLLGSLTDYLPLCVDGPEQLEETFHRALAVAKAFDMQHLHPALLVKLYITAAQGYALMGENKKALDVLDSYTELVTANIYPLKLKGDSFFDMLEQWIETLDLGAALPRDEKIVRTSMVDGVVKNPAFASLAKDEHYQRIVEKLVNEVVGRD